MTIAATTGRSLFRACLLFLLQALITVSRAQVLPESSSNINQATTPCSSAVVQPYDPERHEPFYRVGVLANRGDDTAYAEFNATFADYLTKTAGRRFDPPIRFSMQPLSFGNIFEEHKEVDFIFVNPSAFSCIESEYGAQSLVSQISRRKVAGNSYDLTRFGGVIATMANRTDIETLQDIKGKVVAAASISGLGSGQMQFRELQKAGLSYINDPAQLVFTSNQGKIVKGLLSGDFDVGLIRTDQLERSNGDEDLETFLQRFKIINLQPPQMIENDVPFPFQTSTLLYPEWGVAALSHIDESVSRAVQEALMSLAEHAMVGKAYEDCVQALETTTCDKDFPLLERARCDTTLEIAQSAHTAMTKGKYAGFRSTLSYIDLRSMQASTGFIRLDEEDHLWKCVRSVEIYDAITCADGYFRKTEAEVQEGCAKAGLECHEDYQCICQPCLKGYDVDVYPLQQLEQQEQLSEGNSTTSRGCAKMSLCGSTQQTKPLTFRAFDNLKRDNAEIKVILHEGQESRLVPVVHSNVAYTYEFTLSAELVGVMTLEIFANGEQIPESPLRVLVQDRVCEIEFGNEYEPTANGDCVCKGSHVSVGDNKCIPYSLLLPSIFLPLCGLVALVSFAYVDKKRKEADSIWSVDTKDLKFADPRTVLGQGTFGEVLLAEYHGTSVAVKRVLPLKPTGVQRSGEYSDAFVTPSKDNFIDENDDIEAGRAIGNPEQHPSSAGVDSAGASARKNTAVKFRMGSNNRQASVKFGMGSNDNNNSAVKFGMVSGYRVGTAANNFLRGRQRSGKRSLGKNLTMTATSSSKYNQLRKDFIKEMRLLSKLRHPCITTVMGAVIAKTEEPMLVLEYCEHGSLYDLLHNETLHIEGELLLPILRDIAQGVRFLHSTKPTIVHGDLKSQNVLVTRGFRAKVADFGLSQKAKNAKAMGTPYWMAPELLRGEERNSTASDVYSIGIILYELYSRKDPYDGEDSGEVLSLVCNPKVNKRPPVPDGCPREICDLMMACWHATKKRRPTAESLDERLKLFQVENVQPGANPLSHLLNNGGAPKTASNQDFLYNVFPKHIADSLIRGEKVEPESHECVTIFFSDIVGFTSISSVCSALKVSDLLDRLYHRLDDLSKAHDLFKVETIGDAYMAVSNLIKDQSDDHAKRVAEFAMEAVQEASKIAIDVDDPSKGFVQIRCGFHSGPVVANVVGSLNPRFGLFGDSVNVASRMESTSKTGRVQCSEASAQLLMTEAPDLRLRRRGEMEIKGKGKMPTYFIIGKGTGPASSLATASDSASSLGLE